VHDLRVDYSKIRNEIHLLKDTLKELSKQNGNTEDEIANLHILEKKYHEVKLIKHDVKSNIKNIVKSDIQRGNSIFHKLFIPTGHQINPEAHYSNEELLE
jgi:uncharacterized protein YnzC (UPF0291/DUF896 family)